jgi:hypothetical protein
VSEPRFTYLGAGTFEPGPMLEFLDAWSAATFDEQKHSVARIAADMCWAKPLATSAAFIADLTDYEARATRWVRSYPQYCACFYDLDLFGGNVIIPVINAHPKVWFNGMILENPY